MTGTSTLVNVAACHDFSVPSTISLSPSHDGGWVPGSGILFLRRLSSMQPLLLLGRGRSMLATSSQRSTRAYAAYYYGHQWLRPTGVHICGSRPPSDPGAFFCVIKRRWLLGLVGGTPPSSLLTAPRFSPGRPHDFKNTMTHINAHALAPGLQRFVDGVSSRYSQRMMRPLELTAPSGDTFPALRCGPASPHCSRHSLGTALRHWPELSWAGGHWLVGSRNHL